MADQTLTKTDIENMAIQKANAIFTPDNLVAITNRLHSLIPYQEPRVKESEYLTIIAAARIDGMRELVELIIKSVNVK